MRELPRRNNCDIPYAILRKRESENYLPVSAIQGSTRKFKETRKAFLNLNQKQKDYYNMKGGFRGDERRPVAERTEQKALFEYVPQRILNDLCDGFGKEVWRYFESARDVITADTISLTCEINPDEIPDILDE